MLLNGWSRVAQHEVLTALIRCGDNGVELAHHIQLHIHRIAGVHVLVVLTRPEKGFAILFNLQSFGIDAVRHEYINHLLRKIAPHDGHQIIGFGKIRSGQRNVRGGSADDFICFAKRRFKGVERHGTYGK